MMAILLLIEILVIIINLRVFKNDIFSLATISSMTFLVATLFAFYCADVWQLDLSATTILVITAGLLMMSLGENAGRKFKSGNKVTISDNTELVRLIKIKKNIGLLFCTVVIVCTLLYAYEAHRVGILNGGSGLNAYAYTKMGYTMDGSSRMNILIRQGYKLVVAGAYISCAIIANNCMVLKQNVRLNMEYVFMIFCGILITIFAGARTEILRIVFALLLDYAIFWRSLNGGGRAKNKQSTRVILKKAIPIAFVVAIIAYASRAVVKTSNVSTAAVNSFVYYIAYYIGSPIAVLNNKIEIAFSNGGLLWGSSIKIPEFVYLGRLDYGGNVGTILQTSLLDKGILYMMFYIFVIYLIGGILYKRLIKFRKFTSKNIIFMIVFSSWYYVFSMSYYSDVLSSSGFIHTNIITSFVIIIVYAIASKANLGN